MSLASWFRNLFRRAPKPVEPSPVAVVRHETYDAQGRLIETLQWTMDGVHKWRRRWYTLSGALADVQDGANIPPSVYLGDQTLGGRKPLTETEAKAKGIPWPIR